MASVAKTFTSGLDFARRRMTGSSVVVTVWKTLFVKNSIRNTDRFLLVDFFERSLADYTGLSKMIIGIWVNLFPHMQLA